MSEGSNFSTFLSTLFIVFLFITSIIVVLIHHGVVLIFIFLVTNRVLNFISCAYWPFACISSLGKCLLKSFSHLKDELVTSLCCCKSSLYILETSPLSENGFANIFLRSMGWFSLSGWRFEMWMLKILSKSELLIFFSSCLCFSTSYLRNHCLV